jgi:hypothetical protein
MIAKTNMACHHSWRMQQYSHRKKIGDSVRFDTSFEKVGPIKKQYD